MRLLINDKYQEVNFWSFTKCTILSSLAISGIWLGAVFLISMIAMGFNIFG